MGKAMIIKEEVLFKANSEQVWDLLINPEMTSQYMFGCEVLSDWKVGSHVYWKGEIEDGKEVIFVKGKILEFIEGKKVTSSNFDPNSGMSDTPENYVNLTYELSELKEGTLLTITQGDFEGTEDGEKRYEESKIGWKETVIPMMKKMLLFLGVCLFMQCSPESGFVNSESVPLYGLNSNLVAKPGEGEKLSQILLDASALMYKAKGCHLYSVSFDDQNSDVVWITEIWQSKKDHDSSLTIEGVKELIGKAMPLLKETPKKGQELKVIGGIGVK